MPELHREGLGWLVPSDDAHALARGLVAALDGAGPQLVPDVLRRDVAARFSLRHFADLERIIES